MHIPMQYHAQKAFTLFSICIPRNLEELFESLSLLGWLVFEILNQNCPVCDFLIPLEQIKELAQLSQ
jgi:hypothetical protein